MMNGQGAVVRTGEASPWFQLRMGDLPTGVYLLQTTSQEGATRTARVVKKP